MKGLAQCFVLLINGKASDENFPKIDDTFSNDHARQKRNKNAVKQQKKILNAQCTDIPPRTTMARNKTTTHTNIDDDQLKLLDLNAITSKKIVSV